MNKFMAGLTLGIIITASFFILYDPFQKKPFIPVEENVGDPPRAADSVIKKDADTIRNPTFVQNNNKINRDSLVLFARSLLGTPYLYGSSDPAKGFDCSGFVTFVFNHFQMDVPRSSYGFEHMGVKRSLNDCRPGDLILFKGTEPQEQAIGHIGIIYDIANKDPSFIHSTSGRANGVTITSMDNEFYKDRFIAVIDLLQN